MRDPELLAALARGRAEVDDLMAFWAESHGLWDEDCATETLCRYAAPYVKPIRFNRRQEGVVGADWLWWWVEPSGTCFGMLIQAKNLKRKNTSWVIDFEYANSSAKQMNLLRTSADHFRVAPAYVLYCGDITYRAGLDCGWHHTEPTCTRCTRAGVSVLSAEAAARIQLLTPATAAVEAFQRASPLEDLADPKIRTPPPLWNRENLEPELRSLFHGPQSDALKIAKVMFTQVSTLQISNLLPRSGSRPGHFEDRGDVLRGVRTELPSYVREAEAGRDLPATLTERVAGIAIFYL